MLKSHNYSHINNEVYYIINLIKIVIIARICDFEYILFENTEYLLEYANVFISSKFLHIGNYFY